MKYSDETLMAFADGELEETLRAEIEADLKADAGLARRIAAHRGLRGELQRAYASDLDEAPPRRLLDTLAAPAGESRGSKVVALENARARKPRRAWSPPQWGAIAASLIIGTGAGYMAFRTTTRTPITEAGGVLVADASLARTLSQALTGETPDEAGTRIGISFRSKGGDLCRSFSDGSLAGIACREGAQWQIRLLTQPGAPDQRPYRTASSELPPAIRGAIEADIDGEPFDAQAERDARARGWRAQ